MPFKIPKNPSKKFLRTFLEEQYQSFNTECAVSETLLDPLLVARKFRDEKIALFCALFAYGNVRAILKFLDSCALEYLQHGQRKEKIKRNFSCTNKPYRFQSNIEICDFFQALWHLDSLEEIFYIGYQKGKSGNGILGGIQNLQNAIYGRLKNPNSKGLQFLLGMLVTEQNTSPLKRWNLFLRWMVRKDCLDLGLWSSVDKKDLLLPLDTHTFRISQRLGLLKRKSYDYKAVLEVSEKLREFDASDPIKYDFALYRIGQLGLFN
ncbi:TIGR02757 family protein [Helicobacter turcicus]|uniref:TIGR02757 family protein n=1 Tax=Helicobacter turcicus TaxID=2867412 RepID=A0ABS7JL28_9HELI|nr:TIGR02757 family protein [Helicobacter turcicus]MBX7490107.1 TIGR02757 family protein [Helicobacter turcicus]MBX7544966.1 TIGR02757 family protein [Helicobacter turcicus]